MNKKLTALILVSLVSLAGCTPKENSAGNNQPGKACAFDAAGQAPAAKVDDGKYVYDVFVELWDDDCNSESVANELANDHEGAKPVHVYINGNITGKDGASRPADYMGGSGPEKDVDVPYHLRAFVSPRQAPHDMVVVARVNPGARNLVNDALDHGGFLHCHINRDSAKIPVARGSRDVVTHTVALESGRGQVNCHFTVGVS
jgi:hypothetical protein